MNDDQPQKAAGEKPAAAKSRRRRQPWHRRPLLVGAIMLGAAVAVVAGVMVWRHSRDYVYTDDAFVDVLSERVSPQVAGRVVRVLVDDNQDVAAGQVLLEIDPADYRLELEQGRAGVAEAQAQLSEARAHQAAGEAQAEQARANRDSVRANTAMVVADLARYRSLREANAGAVSRQQLDHADSAVVAAQAQLRAAEKGVAAAEAQLKFYASEAEAALASARSADARVDQARLALSRTEVKSRLAGRVANKTVAEGNYVQPGTPLMAVVPREVYVTANFKEVQLQRLRRGQAVRVKIDSYPDWKLDAHVDSVEPATGQAFSILPAENATGNWVKIVQRVPVKIVFERVPDDPDRRLAPGMSVEATVAVR